MTDPTQPLLLPHRTPPLLEKPKRKSRLGLIGLTALGVFAVVAGVGIASRATEENNLKKQTRADAVQTVAVIDAENGAETQDIVLPGTVQAWHEAVIYARTGGYLKDWKTDIGDKVKEGDVLAEIDAPDLDAQFRQAQADLNTAIANNRIAQITAKRYAELSKSDSVSRQQADQAQATADADVAAAQSSKANLDHLQEEENFKTVVAPFDGTITARNVDVGALINGGNSGAGTGQDMFHIAETSKLRVYVQVPENEATAITPDLTAELNLPQYPQRTFTGKLTNNAAALDPTTRTLLLQFEVDNADGVLLSGSYTDVHLKIPTSSTTIILPVNALLFRDGMQAGVVENGHVHLKHLKIGRDYGKTVEITDGLAVGDKVVVNPPDSLEDGQQVEVMTPKALASKQKADEKPDGKADRKSKSGDKKTDSVPSDASTVQGSAGDKDKGPANDQNTK